jgi:hypothetical protein
MTSVAEHYEKHLAPVYSWMVGGIDNAVSRGEKELAEMGLLNSGAKYAVDLGAGFGMHSIPLGKNGWDVLAIDSSAILLNELTACIGGSSVATAQDDLRNFPQYLAGVPDVVLCMGDTLTHLADCSSVRSLISSVGEHLASGGQFIITFRDYTSAQEGPDRFIPVRSDESRILTCFLDYAEDFIEVHDILHEHNEGTWRMSVSTYKKLRLKPGWVKEQLEECRFEVNVASGMSGMVRIVAAKLPGVYPSNPCANGC